MHRGKVDPGVSELPWGIELSWDHVNRPLEIVFGLNFSSYGNRNGFSFDDASTPAW